MIWLSGLACRGRGRGLWIMRQGLYSSIYYCRGGGTNGRRHWSMMRRVTIPTRSSGNNNNNRCVTGEKLPYTAVSIYIQVTMYVSVLIAFGYCCVLLLLQTRLDLFTKFAPNKPAYHRRQRRPAFHFSLMPKWRETASAIYYSVYYCCTAVVVIVGAEQQLPVVLL